MELFESWLIKNLKIKNRFVMCAMGGVPLYSINGKSMKDSYDYYIRRARGGVGLIITRAMVVKPIGMNEKLFEHPEWFEPMKYLTEGVHSYGAKIFLQLSGGAGRTLHKRVEDFIQKGISKDEAFFAPSDGIPNVWYPEIKHRGLTRPEIHDYIETFGKMGKIAQKVGFDGVEIHAVHEGYLLDQFTIAATNHRTDEYGGSLENRFRLVLEIIEAIKNTCGSEFPIAVRYSVTSKMKHFNDGALPEETFEEYGRCLAEGIEGAKLLEAAGADMLDCDNGSYDAWYWAHPPVYMPNKCNLEEASIVKKHVSIPVVCAGKLDLPEDARRAVQEAKCDAIGLARAFLVEPDYVNKFREKNSIKPCIGCHVGCLNRVARGKIISCALNPAVMQEKRYEHSKVNPKERIAIVGAGISGLEAGILLRECGFDVTIYEKTREIGGNFRYASSFSFKERDKLLLEWYKNKVQELGISIRYGYTVNTPDDLEEEIVIMATGCRPKPCFFPGQSIRVEEYLKDHNLANKDHVIVLGAGLTGLEVAIELCNEGHKVTVIDTKSELFQDGAICDANRLYLEQAIKANKIEILLGTSIEELGIDYVKTNKGSIVSEGYVIIEATGYIPNTQNTHKTHTKHTQNTLNRKIYIALVT